jgi:4-amino-4-deoxy-L-arabinose transferase-like glycosyltransferase
MLSLININQSLWLDEAISVSFANAPSFKSLILNNLPGDFHPPLYYLILKSVLLVFPPSEIVLRLPSVIFGVATVFVVYLIAKKLYDQKTALIASILAATGPLFIYYQQEARMYMLTALLTSLSVYFFISIFKKDKLINWVGFISSTSLMLYADYLPYLILPTYLLFLIVNKKTIAKSTLRSFIPSFLLIGIFISPWFFVLKKQLAIGISVSVDNPLWARILGEANAKNLALTFIKFTIGRISPDNNIHYTLLLIPIGLIIFSVLMLSFFRISKSRSFLWYWLVITLILAFLISFFIPIFSYFRFIFLLPAFYILLAAGINTINWALPTRILLSLVLIINLTSTLIYLLNPKFHRENWKEAVAYISAQKTPNTVVLFEANYSMPPFDYYNKEQIRSYGVLSGFSPKEEDVNKTTMELTKKADKIFLFEYLATIADPQGLAFGALSKNGFTNTSTKDFRGIGFLYEFSR